MIAFAADENFNYDIVRGLRRRLPDVDVISVQESGLTGADDPTILEWAARARLADARRCHDDAIRS
jgi:hypothetical protein